MDIFAGLAIAIVVQIAGYIVTNRVVEDSIDIIVGEVKDRVIEERKQRGDQPLE